VRRAKRREGKTMSEQQKAKAKAAVRQLQETFDALLADWTSIEKRNAYKKAVEEVEASATDFCDSFKA
jgi:hypothetical protein